MTYNIVTNYSEPTDILVSISQEVPILMPSLLFMIVIGVSMAAYFAQERRYGRVNIWSSMTVGSFIVSIIAAIFYLIENLVNLETVVMSLMTFFICALIYFTTDKD